MSALISPKKVLVPVVTMKYPFGIGAPLTVTRPGRGRGVAPVLLAFAAGLLLGVPVTFCALYLGSLTDAPLPTLDLHVERYLGPSPNSFTSAQQTIFREAGRPPVATRPTNVRKSGLGAWRIASRRGKAIASHTPARQDAPDFEALVDGVFWSDLSESFVPRGFVDDDAVQWRRFINATRVLRLEAGCGRMQNRLLLMRDGVRACARYRHNSDQIQGDIFSFHLGRILGIQNLPPAALALPDPHTQRWSTVDQQMVLARWTPDRPAVLARFVDGLRPAFVPRQLREAGTRSLHPVREDLSNMTAAEVSELVQWSDLVVFDYLTANLDRVVNNLYNKQWNPGMMSEAAHNLAATPDGLLVFLDNESGLLHGYRLLDKYEPLHRTLLDALCVFRARTVRVLEVVHREDNVEVLLRTAFREGEPGMPDWLPFLPDSSVRILKERIGRVLGQVNMCRTLFATNRSTRTSLS